MADLSREVVRNEEARLGRSRTSTSMLGAIVDDSEDGPRAGAAHSGFMSTARPITPSGKIPAGAPRRKTDIAGTANAAGTLKRRAKKKRAKNMEVHHTFELVKKGDDAFNNALKGGQVSMTGVVDRFIDQNVDNLLIYFGSKEFLATNGVNRYRAALGLAWYYRAAILVLLVVTISLSVLIGDENEKLIGLEQVLDVTTAEQQDARRAYERVMVDERINLIHTSHNLPIRRVDEPDTGVRFHRSCQCFGHKHAIPQDYHLTGWEVHERHSLTAARLREQTSTMTRGSAKVSF